MTSGTDFFLAKRKFHHYVAQTTPVLSGREFLNRAMGAKKNSRK